MPKATFAFGYSQNDSRIFVVGGATGQERFNAKLYQYNKKIDRWVNLPLREFPKVRYTSALYLEKYNSLLVAGGLSEEVANVVLAEDVNLISIDHFDVKNLGNLLHPAKNVGMTYWNDQIYFFWRS